MPRISAKIDVLLGLSLLVALVVLRVVDPYPLESLRLGVFDAYQRMKPRPASLPTMPAAASVVVVTIDEAGMREYGHGHGRAPCGRG